MTEKATKMMARERLLRLSMWFGVGMVIFFAFYGLGAFTAVMLK
jgi:hypothetical protein